MWTSHKKNIFCQLDKAPLCYSATFFYIHFLFARTKLKNKISSMSLLSLLAKQLPTQPVSCLWLKLTKPI